MATRNHKAMLAFIPAALALAVPALAQQPHLNPIQKHPTISGLAAAAATHHALKVSARNRKANGQKLNFASAIRPCPPSVPVASPTMRSKHTRLTKHSAPDTEIGYKNSRRAIWPGGYSRFVPVHYRYWRSQPLPSLPGRCAFSAKALCRRRPRSAQKMAAQFGWMPTPYQPNSLASGMEAAREQCHSHR